MTKVFGTETQESIAQWALDTFGDVTHTRTILTRANCEFAELVHAVECSSTPDKLAGEIADVIIVLARYPVRIVLDDLMTFPDDSVQIVMEGAKDALAGAMSRGSSQPLVEESIRLLVDELARLCVLLEIDLPAAIDAKMQINRGRQWTAKGAGHGQHVASPAVSEHDRMTSSLVNFANAYRNACAAIAPAYVALPRTERGTVLMETDEQHALFVAYHATLTAAANARRALLAAAAGDTPEITYIVTPEIT